MKIEHKLQRSARSRSGSIALPHPTEEKWLWSLETLFYATLLVFVAMVSLTMLGCTKPEAEKVEYGPEVDRTAVINAIAKPLENSDLTTIKLGAFVHIAATQEVAGGQMKNVLADVGQTVISREETATDINLTVIENVISYSQGESRKASTEYPVVIPKASQAALVQAAQVKASAQLDSARTQSLRLLNVSTQSEATKITYHNLKVSVASEPAPQLVSQQPGCMGLANCRMEVHRISFDQVIWSSEKGERIHFDYAISPDMPFWFVFGDDGTWVEKPMDNCMTLMVPIGDSGAKTLLKQCQTVVNFRFQAAQ